MLKIIKEEKGTIIFMLIMAMVIGIYAFTMLHWSREVVKDHRIEYVCDYLGGNVEGNVCLIDGKVVDTKGKFDE